MRDVLITIIASVLCTPFVLVSISIGWAEGMGSASYRIESDSINFGGGFSSSTEYTLESTLGEVATGESSSASYALKAGYQQMHEVYIALSGIVPVTLSPSIPGITGGESNGSTTITVTTDSSSGYSLSIEAGTSSAMRSGVYAIDDYAPLTSDPDFMFTTDSADAHFGFSPEGVEIVTRYQDNGVSCGGGGGDVTLSCWDGLSTTSRTIASRTTANHPNGSTTTIHFRVGVGGGVSQPPGIYTATTTLTALPL